MEPTTAINAVLFTVLFLSGCISIWFIQALGYPFKFFAPHVYAKITAIQKRKFGALLVSVCHFFTRTQVEFILPRSLHASRDGNGNPTINWKKRAVVIANHQLYNDWIYAWWLAYTANIHEAPLIMLKESIKKVPIFGWTGSLWQFLYMARKWKTDGPRIDQCMKRIAKSPSSPTWLLMFPEGTVTSPDTVARSRAFCEKIGQPIPRNVLFPRTKGLEACFAGLNKSIETVYDLTIYYDGVPEGQYGEVFYSLKRMYWEGLYPPTVKIYVREFSINDIPIESGRFEAWMYKLWAEKDDIMDQLKSNSIKPSAKFPAQLNTYWDLFDIYQLPLAFTLIGLAYWYL